MDDLDEPEDIQSEEVQLSEFEPDDYLSKPSTKQNILNLWRTKIIRYEAEKRENARLYPFAEKINAKGFEKISDVYKRAKAHKYQYLIENMLPQRSYGPISAEYKAGKTWIVSDLCVTGIFGLAFLSHFKWVKPINQETNEVEDVRIAVFIGEGDENEFVRRCEAVCKFYNVDPEEFFNSDRLLVQFRPPNVSDPDDMQRIHGVLSDFKPHLTILDPWYLSAGENADSRNLQSMGLVLRNIQGVCQDVDSALIIMHHWNQTGEGKGFNRAAGAGLQEWGRILGNLSIESQPKSDPNDRTGKTVARLHLEFKGQVSSTYRFTREVWSEDKADLSTPMTYKLIEGNQSTSESSEQLDENQLAYRILDAVYNALKKNDCCWNKTQINAEVSKGIKTRNSNVSDITGYMERHGLIEFSNQAASDSLNPTKSERKVWKYPGDEFVRAKRAELREGLVHEWNELKVVKLDAKKGT